MLKQLGVEFTAVGNGREAVEAVARAPFDVALMDCQMPEMDGFEATRAIRAREATAPSAARRLTIVALTANAMAEDRERCLSAGMDDHLAKPYSVDQLRQLLQRWRPAVAA
jgi:CheY-like chemotaxis protein